MWGGGFGVLGLTDGRSTREGSGHIKAACSPFFPLFNKNPDVTHRQGEILRQYSRSFQKHTELKVCVSFPVLSYVNPHFLVPCSVQFLFLDYNRWGREGLPYPNGW